MLRFEVTTSRPIEAMDVTDLVRSRRWPDGLLLLSVEHTTAALFLGESGLEMFAVYLYQQGFQFLQLGHAAAASYVLTCIIVLISILQKLTIGRDPR